MLSVPEVDYPDRPLFKFPRFVRTRAESEANAEENPDVPKQKSKASQVAPAMREPDLLKWAVTLAAAEAPPREDAEVADAPLS